MQPTTRREFLRQAATVGGVSIAATIAPFAFVRASTMDRPGLDSYIETRRRLAHSPGLSVAVVSASGLEFANGYGWANREAEIPADADTVYMLASVSKTLTCAGVLCMVEDGALDLDANVNDILPFDIAIPNNPGAVTLRQLLTHTSSIRDRGSVWGHPGEAETLYSHGDSQISLGAFLESYLVPSGERYVKRQNFYDRKPGKSYAYSNIGVDLAAYAAEIVADKPFTELITERVTEPLGLRQAGFHLSEITTENLAMPYASDARGHKAIYQYGYPDYPCGAFRASATELGTWLQAFMNFGEGNDTRILDEATVREIRTNQHVASWNQGLIWWSGWGPGAFRHMGHTGGDAGVSTRMFFRPDKRIGVITLSNGSMLGPHYKPFHDVEKHLFDVFS